MLDEIIRWPTCHSPTCTYLALACDWREAESRNLWARTEASWVRGEGLEQKHRTFVQNNSISESRQTGLSRKHSKCARGQVLFEREDRFWGKTLYNLKEKFINNAYKLKNSDTHPHTHRFLRHIAISLSLWCAYALVIVPTQKNERQWRPVETGWIK